MVSKNNNIEISWSSLWRILAMVIFAVALYYVRETIIMVFTAVVISSAMYSPVKYLEKKGVPRIVSVLSIFLIAIAILVIILYTLIPIALIQFQYLLDNISSLESPILDTLGASSLINQLESEVYGVFKTLFSGGMSVLGVFTDILSNIFFILSAVVLSFYLAISKNGIERFLKAIMPAGIEDDAIKFYQRTRKKLERWLGGQLLLSFVVGSLTFIGLTIVGNKYAILLSVLAAILELVPYVGPITVGVMAFLITLPESFTAAIIVVLMFFIIQEVENNLLVPIIMSKAVGTDPVTVVIALIAGAQLAGILGMLLAVPSVIIIEGAINDWSERKYGRRKTVEEK